MLEIRPNCEYCDIDLPANSKFAMICSYECTFCTNCVEDILRNVCPNCGGGFSPRPIRPKQARRDGVSLLHQPASEKRVKSSYGLQELKAFAESAHHVKAAER